MPTNIHATTTTTEQYMETINNTGVLLSCDSCPVTNHHQLYFPLRYVECIEARTREIPQL